MFFPDLIIKMRCKSYNSKYKPNNQTQNKSLIINYLFSELVEKDNFFGIRFFKVWKLNHAL